MIREANVNDYIDIHKICCQDLGYNCNADLVKERLKNLDASREKVFVAIMDGKVVGYVHAEQYNTLYFESLVNILGLAVSKAYRRRGCGKALMRAVENWAKVCGIHAVRLNSGQSRTEAHIFYRSIGYDNEKAQIRFFKNLTK